MSLKQRTSKHSTTEAIVFYLFFNKLNIVIVLFVNQK